MRCVPGVHGLAALFAAVRHAETQRDMAHNSSDTDNEQPCDHGADGLFGNGDPGGNACTGETAIGTAATAPLSHAFIGDVNPLTTIALPSDEDWRVASTNDHDIGYILRTIAAGEKLKQKDLRESKYFREWLLDGFEADNGILYRYEEGRRARTRQLRVRVVPNSLRMAVFAACHASPMAGHSGAKRTLFRIEARFW